MNEIIHPQTETEIENSQTEADKSPSYRTDRTNKVQSLSGIDNRKTLLKLAYVTGGFALTTICARLFFNGIAIILTLPVGVFLASWTQSAILEELHDGYHYRLFSSRNANEVISNLYCSLVGISLNFGRNSHNRHHRFFGTSQDPDYPIYSKCPAGLRSWLNYIVIQFTGFGALRGMLTGQGLAAGGKSSWQHPYGTLVMQLLLFVLGWIFIHPLAYFVFWFYPLISLTFGVGRFRTMIEHWNPIPYVDPVSNKTLYGALYNFDGVFQRNLMGAQFGYNFHGAHHLAPSIPNYNLNDAAHSEYICPPELVRSTSYYDRLKEVLFNKGYPQENE